MATSLQMRLTRDRLRHAYRRTKVLGKQAWDTTERVLSVMDRGANLAAHGMLALGDRLDPEVRAGAGKALQHYGSTRVKMENLKGNVQRVGRAVKDAGFEF
jgi:hypothetical protein